MTKSGTSMEPNYNKNALTKQKRINSSRKYIFNCKTIEMCALASAACLLVCLICATKKEQKKKKSFFKLNKFNHCVVRSIILFFHPAQHFQYFAVFAFVYF